MCEIEVVAFHEVFRQAFPIGLPGGLFRETEDSLRQVIILDVRHQPGKAWRKRFGVTVEVDEQETFPYLGLE